MMNKVWIYAILLASFISGCATSKTTNSLQLSSSLTQPKEIIFEVGKASYSKQDCVKGVIGSLRGRCDKFEEEYIKSMVDDELIREGYKENIKNLPLSTNSMKEEAEKYFKYVFNKLFFDYELKYNTATGKSLHPQIYTNFIKSEKEEMDSQVLSTVTRFYSTVTLMSWSWGETEGGHAEGKAVINYAIKYELPDLELGKLKATVRITDVKIDDPLLILFRHKVAEISLNQNIMEAALSSIPQKQYFDKATETYINIVGRLKSKAMMAILNRYQKEQLQSIESAESVYNINFDIAVARLQRKLNSYMYDKDNSRFNFSDNIDLSTGSNAEIELAIKMYPESGGKTATVYQLKYTPIYDSFSKNYLYGSKNAEKYLHDQITKVNSLLNKP